IKFTPPGGAIRIEAERRESEMLLTVADTGIGIPLSDRARVLGKLECGTPRSSAGLGLSLVTSLVELHGGTVRIDSATGRGTTITCRLPTALREFTDMLSSAQAESRAAA